MNSTSPDLESPTPASVWVNSTRGLSSALSLQPPGSRCRRPWAAAGLKQGQGVRGGALIRLWPRQLRRPGHAVAALPSARVARGACWGCGETGWGGGAEEECPRGQPSEPVLTIHSLLTSRPQRTHRPLLKLRHCVNQVADVRSLGEKQLHPILQTFFDDLHNEI